MPPLKGMGKSLLPPYTSPPLSQLTATQVTNPPIDPLREGLVMSLNMRLGKRGNLLQPGPGSYNQLLLETPILVESELEAIQTSSGLSSKVLPRCPTSELPWN